MPLLPPPCIVAAVSSQLVIPITNKNPVPPDVWINKILKSFPNLSLEVVTIQLVYKLRIFELTLATKLGIKEAGPGLVYTTWLRKSDPGLEAERFVPKKQKIK